MDKGINNNGYDYVDLDLPSGTLWATMNVGASKPSDCGLYFQWGDTQGYTAEQVGIGEGQKKFALDWSDYKFGVYPNYSKYTTPGVTLGLEDDAAHINMGGDWHIPTPEQISELLDNTTNAWTTQDGINGRLFTSKKDGSKSIFIPAAGYACGGSFSGVGDEAVVWASVLNTDDVYNGQYLYFNSDSANLFNINRYYGFSVRGVIDQSNDNSKEKNMNENLDLRQILKDAPEGLGLWSYACGICEFKQIVKYTDYPIVCKTINKNGEIVSIEFTKEGKRDTIYSNGECVLFPSKENHDWSTFKLPNKHKHFEPYQKVLCAVYRNYGNKVWDIDLYSHYDENTRWHYLLSNLDVEDDDVIPYEGNEDKLGKIVK